MPIFKKLKVPFDSTFENKKFLFLVFLPSGALFMQKIVNNLHAQSRLRHF